MDRALRRTTAVNVRNVDAQTQIFPGRLHVDICVSHRGNGADGFNHVADDVDDGQVDDGPVGSRRRLLRDARPPSNERLIRLSGCNNTWSGSLEFPQPGVGDDGSQDGREVTEAAERVVDGRGQVLVPFQVGEEVERQHRCEGGHTGTSCETGRGAP